MNRSIVPISLAVVLGVSAAGCDKPGVTEQQKESQANEQAANATNQAMQQVDNAQAAAERNIASARTDFEKTREAYLHTRRVDLADLDEKIANLDANARVAKDQKKTAMLSRLPAIHAQRDAFVSDMQALQSTTAATWDNASANLDKEWDALRQSVANANGENP